MSKDYYYYLLKQKLTFTLYIYTKDIRVWILIFQYLYLCIVYTLVQVIDCDKLPWLVKGDHSTRKNLFEYYFDPEKLFESYLLMKPAQI